MEWIFSALVILCGVAVVVLTVIFLIRLIARKSKKWIGLSALFCVAGIIVFSIIGSQIWLNNLTPQEREAFYAEQQKKAEQREEEADISTTVDAQSDDSFYEAEATSGAIDDVDNFIVTWNNMPNSVVETSLIFHGGPHAMSMGKGVKNNLAVRASEYTNGLSKDVQEKISFVDELYSTGANINIYSCNAGHLDHADDNLAQEFTRITTGTVYACDGSVSYYKGLLGSGLSKFLGGYSAYEPHLSDDQSSFRDQCIEPREPTGFRIWN